MYEWGREGWIPGTFYCSLSFQFAIQAVGQAQRQQDIIGLNPLGGPPLAQPINLNSHCCRAASIGFRHLTVCFSSLQIISLPFLFYSHHFCSFPSFLFIPSLSVHSLPFSLLPSFLFITFLSAHSHLFCLFFSFLFISFLSVHSFTFCLLLIFVYSLPFC